jgi:predicted ATPase/signal transduction histidine kinase/class 3 adenylate cyclase
MRRAGPVPAAPPRSRASLRTPGGVQGSLRGSRLAGSALGAPFPRFRVAGSEQNVDTDRVRRIGIELRLGNRDESPWGRAAAASVSTFVPETGPNVDIVPGDGVHCDIGLATATAEVPPSLPFLIRLTRFPSQAGSIAPSVWRVLYSGQELHQFGWEAAMSDIDGFSNTEHLVSTPKRTFFRGTEATTNERKLVEVVPPEGVDPAQVQTEIAVYQSVSRGEVRSEGHRHGMAIIRPDAPGDVLSVIIREIAASGISGLIDLGIAIAELVSEVHQNGFVLRNLSPRAILWDRTGLGVTVLDASASARLVRQATVPLTNPSPDCLAYLAPELTGRLTATPDHRSDLYAMGAILYEAARGHPPFVSDDPLELVHAHIALRPEPVSGVSGELPEPLAAIIMQLLEKRPESRYQTAAALARDLVRCRTSLAKRGVIEPFAIGEGDLRASFILPDRLYGRDPEITALQRELYEAFAGKSRFVAITGPAGIGKSALIGAVADVVAAERGYVIRGKFDLLDAPVPYQGVADALGGHVRWLLSEPQPRLDYWRARILQALGSNARVLTDLIPVARVLLGEHPPVEPLPSRETRQRLDHVLLQTMRAFTSPEHPVLLYLDDLQWADESSIGILQKITGDPQLETTLIMTAMRPDDPGAQRAMVRSLAESAGTRIELGPMADQDTAELIGDVLQTDRGRCSDLADLVAQKTGGNPFFVRELLESLYDQGFIRRNGGWSYDLEAISGAQISDDVAAFMAGRVGQVAGATLRILKMAALTGTRVALPTLGRAMECGASELRTVVQPAEVLGLVTATDTELWFTHDRVRESVLASIAAAEARGMHLAMGRALLERVLQGDEEVLFGAAYHLNAAADAILDEDERLSLRTLNLQAAHRAWAAGAYAEAAEYYAVAERMATGTEWDTDHDVTFDAHVTWAECAYLAGDAQGSELLVRRLRERVKGPVDLAKVNAMVITILIGEQGHAEAIALGLESLRAFGYRVPADPSMRQLMGMLLKALWAYRRFRRSPALQNTTITDPELLSVLSICESLSIAAFMVGGHLSGYTGALMMLVTFRAGMAPQTPYALAILGSFIYSGYFNRTHGAVAVCDLAIQVAERLGTRRGLGKALYVAHWVEPWRTHLLDSLHLVERGAEESFASGDYFYVGFDLLHSVVTPFMGGMPLVPAQEVTARSEDVLTSSGNLKVLDVTRLFRRLMEILSGNESMDWHAEYMRILEKAASSRDETVQCQVHGTESLLNYLRGDVPAAVSSYRECDKVREGIRGHFGLVFFDFVGGLSHAAHALETGDGASRAALRRICRRYRRHARHGPVNYGHRYALLRAELASLRRRDRDGPLRLYDRAIAEALEHRYPNEAAIACWRAAEHCRRHSLPMAATGYILRAIDLFEEWGARIVAERLRHAYGVESAGAVAHGVRSGGDDAFAKRLDAESIARSIQTISRELDLPSLLSRILRIIMESAGATFGAVLLPDGDEEMTIATTASYGAAAASYSATTASYGAAAASHSAAAGTKDGRERHERVPMSIVRYAARTGETVVIADSSRDAKAQVFHDLGYDTPVSVLCVPARLRDELVAVLYLVNELAPGAFDEARLDTVRLLSAQAAISIENARLYGNLEGLVTERTAELERRNDELQEAHVRLQEMDRLKSAFFSNISHEFRTPLTMILSPLSEALRAGTTDDPERVRELLFTIESNGKRLLRLINNLLDYSKIEAGRYRVERTRTDVAELLRSYVSTIKSAADTAGIAVAFNDNSSGVTAAVDRDIIEKAVFNLLSNAIKFTERGGSIIVQLDGPADGCFQISVRDTGCGIAPDKLETVFERFAQVGTGHRATPGTGIGLAFSRDLVRLHEGDITVRSQLGRGAHFTINLPVGDVEAAPEAHGYRTLDGAPLEFADLFEQEETRSPASPATERTPEEGLEGRPLVLVVEDAADMRRFIVGLLRSRYQVMAAADGVEALERCRQSKPDVIVSDIMMPRLTGNELVAAVRNDPELQDIRTILLTAKADAQMRVEGLTHGADDYLGKPFDPDELRARIEGQLRRKAIHDETERQKGLLKAEVERQLALIMGSERLRPYLPPELVKEVIEGGHGSVRQESHRRMKVSILFTDIAGFSATTDRMAPEEIAAMLNEYLAAMSGIVERHGGTVDKFIGDGLLAHVGVYDSMGTEEDAVSCVRIAVDMQRHMPELNAAWRRRGITRPLLIRCGVNTGYCTVGDFGSESRRDRTLIGGEVNLASRLESAAEPGGVLISESTKLLVEHAFQCAERGEISVEGFSHPVRVFAVTDPALT